MCRRQPPYRINFGGDKRIRTADPLRARQVLYQLSYIPELTVVEYHNSKKNARASVKNDLSKNKISSRNKSPPAILSRRRSSFGVKPIVNDNGD